MRKIIRKITEVFLWENNSPIKIPEIFYFRVQFLAIYAILYI